MKNINQRIYTELHFVVHSRPTTHNGRAFTLCESFFSHLTSVDKEDGGMQVSDTRLPILRYYLNIR